MLVDGSTIQLARTGDRRARATLLAGLQDVWYRFALGLLGDAQAAREATQETAMRFLQRLGEFRGHSQLRTWSLGIALNVVREMRRRPAMAQLIEEPPIAQAGPVEALMRQEDQGRVRSLLAALPPRQREAVVLRFFEELSVEETAQAMQCSEGTVKATVHQALRALRLGLDQSVRP
jgi:RNA polymerase sigma-70 factor (ECF subfamily)